MQEECGTLAILRYACVVKQFCQSGQNALPEPAAQTYSLTRDERFLSLSC